MVGRRADDTQSLAAATMQHQDESWDMDIQAARNSVHAPARLELARAPGHRLRSDSFQRSATMTIAMAGEQAPLSGSAEQRHVAVVVSSAAGGLLLLATALALLTWRCRTMKRSSEKICKLRQDEKDPWMENTSGKSTGCLKLCTESIRGSGLPIYYHRAEQQSPLQASTPTADPANLPRQRQQLPAAPPPAAKSRIPPPLEHVGGGGGAHRWTDNVVYISGYSPTLERRRPPAEPAEPAATVHHSAAYRTLPSKQKRMQQMQEFYAGASALDVGSAGTVGGAGEVSPDRVDLMLLDEEMRTRSLPSWMRNKTKGKLQDASQHPLNFSHRQRNRMGNDAASVIARAKTQYPSRSGQEPYIVYDVRTAL